MGLTIRDDFMSMMQDELSGISGAVFATGCMDRRLTKIFESIMESKPGSTIIRTAGGFLNCSEAAVEQLVRDYDTGIVTSHRGCGAAKVVVGAEKDRGQVPTDVFEQVVNPFAMKGCTSNMQVEGNSPEMQKDFIERIAAQHDLGKKNIIMRCMDTPTPLSERPAVTELVITTPLKSRYSELPGVNPNDDTKYYLHNDLSSMKCDIWIAVTAIKVSSIQPISQSKAENDMMVRFTESLKNDPDIQRFGVRVNPPRLSDVGIKIGIPQRPSVGQRDRSRL
jgi:hypothetical protein